MARKIIAISLVAVLLCSGLFVSGIHESSDAIYINMSTDHGEFNCRYDDDYFFGLSSEYNPSLVTASYCMVMSCVGVKNDDSGSDRGMYLFSQKAGFTAFESNDDFKSKPTTETLGVAIASKPIANDYTLLMVGFRWSGYESEWANNFMMGLGDSYGHHEGFKNRADDKVFPFINQYIENHNISGKIKIWIGGYSRGGGMSNIVAGMLDTSIVEKRTVINNVTFSKNDIFAFTFEAPKTISPKSGMDVKGKDYDNIWNFYRPSDLVTTIPPASWGFKLYGHDIKLPELGFNREFGKEWYTFSVFYEMKGRDMDGLVTTAYAFGESGLIERLDNPRYPSLSGDLSKAINTLADKIGSRENFVNGGFQKSCFDLFEVTRGTTGATKVLKDVGFDLLGSPLTVLEMLIALENEDRETFRADILQPITDALTKEKLDPSEAGKLADSLTFLVFLAVDMLKEVQDETMEVPLTLALNALYIVDNHSDYYFAYCWFIADDPLIFLP